MSQANELSDFDTSGRIALTTHAQQRMAQRNLSLPDIEFILHYGQHFHRAGVVFFYLRRKDIPTDMLREKSIAQLEGVAVVCSSDSPTVVTVWRNRESGLRSIKRKPSYSFKWEIETG